MSEGGAITGAFVSLGIAFVFVLMRCYCRFVLIKSFGIDDLFVIFSFLSAVVLTYFIILAKRYALSGPAGDLSPFALSSLIKALWGALICFCFGCTLSKASAILQCLRFILYGRMRICCWVFLALIFMFGITSICLSTFHCKPIRAYWTPDLPGAKCLNLIGYWYFGSAAIMLADVVVVAIPVLTVKNLKIRRGQKLALMAVFVLGGFACICSIIRTIYIALIGRTQDIVRSNAEAAVWSSLECNIGIICVSVPPLKPLVVKIAPSLLRPNQENGGGGGIDLAGTELSGDTLMTQTEDRPSKDTPRPVVTSAGEIRLAPFNAGHSEREDVV